MKSKPVEELVNKDDPGWPLVEEWLEKATNHYEVLPADKNRAQKALTDTQVTTRSPMGAIIYHTGGILVDHCWIRILGSGCNKLPRSLPEWNKGKTVKKAGMQPTFLLVADDVIGGFFAVNGGGLGKELGDIYYFAPDTLEWESLEISYSDFLNWCFKGDLNTFYQDFRWTNWQQEVESLNGDQVFVFYPSLFTKAESMENRNRKKASINEVYKMYAGHLEGSERR